MSKSRKKAAQEIQPPWTFYLIGVLASLAMLTPLLPAGALGGPVLLKSSVWFWIILPMLAVWITLAAGSQRYRPAWRHPVVITASAWVLFLLVTLPFSGNPELSFWSNRDRVIGVHAALNWLVWMIILSSTLKDWKSWRPVLATTLFVSVLIGIIGLLEASGQSAGWRIESTQGNAIYLSSYALPHVFIALMMLARAPSWPRRAIYAFAGLINIIVLIQTSTRGAWVALAAGLLLAAGGYLQIFSKNRKRATILLLALIAAAGLLIAGGLWARQTETGQAWGKKHIPLRLHRLIYHDFGSDRISLWRMGLLGWQDAPLLGHGLENYSNSLNKYIDEQEDWALIENWYDRTHNQMIDILMGTGIIGTIFYLGLWISLYWVLLRSIRRTDKDKKGLRILLWLMIPLFFAQSIASFFAFETPSAVMVTWLVMAMAVSLTRRPPTEEEQREESAPADFITVAVLVLIAFLAGWWLHWRPYRQAVTYNLTMANAATQPQETTDKLTELFDKTGFVIHDLRYNLLSRLRSISENSKMPRTSMEPLIVLAAAEADKTLANRPTNYKALLATAYINRELSTYQEENLDYTRDLLQRTIAASSSRPEAYEELAEVEIVAGNLDEAARQLEIALTKSRHNMSTGRIYMRQAGVMAMQGDLDGAEVKVREAKKIYNYAIDFRQAVPFAEAIRPGEPRPVLMEYLKTVYSSRRNNAMAIAVYAIGLAKHDQKAEARALVQQLEKMDPTAAEQITKVYGL